MENSDELARQLAATGAEAWKLLAKAKAPRLTRQQRIAIDIDINDLLFGELALGEARGLAKAGDLLGKSQDVCPTPSQPPCELQTRKLTRSASGGTS